LKTKKTFVNVALLEKRWSNVNVQLSDIIFGIFSGKTAHFFDIVNLAKILLYAIDRQVLSKFIVLFV